MSISAPDIRAERGKRAALLARQIEDDIAAAGWQVGTVFGTEPELCARYGASRSVLFEAVRLIEHHQVATMRRGPKGGLVIQEPDLRRAVAALVIYLDHVGTTVADLMELRIVLEPLAVRAVAESLTPDGVAALRAAMEEDSGLDYSSTVALSDRIHQTIAALCGNPVLDIFLRVLVNLNVLFADPTRRTTKKQVEAAAAEMGHEHEELVDAIIAGDAARAERLASDHLARLRDLMLANGAVGHRPPGRIAWPQNGSARFAETVAGRIRSDLVRSGAVPGDVVGSETQLREQYAVSRQVLREAVRLLEHHGVAKMQRGPGGGLVVTEPDPWASIEAITVFLDSQEMRPQDLRAVWVAIELACVERVVARRDEEGIAARLRAKLDLTDPVPTDPGEIVTSSLHHELAALSGSPLLELFFLILTALWQRHVWGSDAAALLNDGERRRIARVQHEELVEAMLAGDSAGARTLMARHLGAVAEPWEQAGR